MKRYVANISMAMLLFPFVVNSAPLMYVAAGNANDLVVIDLETDRIVGRIGELENAHGLSGSPNSEYLVAGSMKPLESNESSSPAKPSVVSEAEHMAHHAGNNAGREMAGKSYLSIVQPKDGQVIRRVAVRGLTHHTAVSPDGKYAIAVHSGAGGISVVDLNKMEVVKAIQTGQWPNYAIFGRDGKYLYITNAGPGTVSEIDTRDWSIRREITVGKKPEHMVLSPDGSTLFVANVDEGTATAVDLKKGVVAGRFDVGAEPHGIDISKDGRWLFVTSKGDQKLSRIDLMNNSISTIDLQPAPYHVAYVGKTGKTGKLYISSRKEPKIWVLDSSALKIKGEINIGQGVAHQMVTLPSGDE